MPIIEAEAKVYAVNGSKPDFTFNFDDSLLIHNEMRNVLDELVDYLDIRYKHGYGNYIEIENVKYLLSEYKKRFYESN